MVTHDITIPEVENTQVRGRDDSRQRRGTSTRDTSTPKAEGADTSPRRMTKALTSALKKRRMMVMAGAGEDALAVIDARIERLGGRVTPITDAVESPAKPAKPAAETPDERLRRLMTARLAVIDAKRARVAALRAELAAAEADLARTVEVAATAPLIEGVTPLIEDAENTEQPAVSSSPEPVSANPFAVARRRADQERAEREAADRRALAVLGEGFAPYEPSHVRAVAEGAPARWVRGDDGAWYVAARADQVMESRWVEVERVDGSVSVELLSEAFAVTEMDGVTVAVCSVVPDVIGEVSSGSTNWS